ncbi:MAG: YajQ family cyclic di-GMP-binding protein [Myxococcales bacterium]|nr:YajQ family cyclic di-GMP-binding protein [Myxococcales bacterium]MCB9533966.1 YajQ family cyclic di-GMP-binding protein [Myxococcales bacterium]
MPSFDVVSEIDLAELTNAVVQAQKEIGTRYDFRGTDTAVEQDGATLRIVTASQQKLEAVHEVLRQKLTRREVPVENLDYGKVESASGNRVRQSITLKQGVDKEAGKEIVKALKEHNKKLQASIQGETVRVTGKSRDELQAAIAFLRGSSFGLTLQYKNFRD